MESSCMLFINIFLGNALLIYTKETFYNERGDTRHTFKVEDPDHQVYDIINNVHNHRLGLGGNIYDKVNEISKKKLDAMLKAKKANVPGYNSGEPKVTVPWKVNARDKYRGDTDTRARFQRHLTRKPKTPSTIKIKKKKKRKKKGSTKVFDLGETFDVDDFEKYINQEPADREFEKDVIKNLGGNVSDSDQTEVSKEIKMDIKTKINNETVIKEICGFRNRSSERNSTNYFGNIEIPDIDANIDEDLTPENDASSEYNQDATIEKVLQEKTIENKELEENKKKVSKKKFLDKDDQILDTILKEAVRKKSKDYYTKPIKEIANKTKVRKKNETKPNRRVKRFAKKGKKKRGGGGGGRGRDDPFGGYGGFKRQKNTNNKYKGGKGKGGGGGGKGKKKGGGGDDSEDGSGFYMDMGDFFQMGDSDDDSDDDDGGYYDVDSESEFSHRGGRGRGGHQYQQNKNNQKQNKNKNKHQNKQQQQQQQGDGIVREKMKLTEIKENDSIFEKGKIKVVSNKNGKKTEREEYYARVVRRLEYFKSPNTTQKRVKRFANKPKKKNKDVKRGTKSPTKKKAKKDKKSKTKVKKETLKSEEITREKLKITELKSGEDDDTEIIRNDDQTTSESSEQSGNNKNDDETLNDDGEDFSADVPKKTDTEHDEKILDDNYSDELNKIDLNKELGYDVNKLKQKYEVDTTELRANVFQAKHEMEEEKRKKKGGKDVSEEMRKKKKKMTTKRKDKIKRRPTTKHTTKKRREKKKVFDYSLEFRDKKAFVKTGIKALIKELNVSTRCDYCGSGKASIQHVLAGCKMALYFGFYSRRHDRVLQTIRNAFQEALDQTNSSLGIVAPSSSAPDVISPENMTEVNILFLSRLRYILSHPPDTGNVTKKRGRKAKTTPTIPQNNSDIVGGVNDSLCEEDLVGNKTGLAKSIDDEEENTREVVRGHISESGDSGTDHSGASKEEKGPMSDVHDSEEGDDGGDVDERGSGMVDMEAEEEEAELEGEGDEDEMLVTKPMVPQNDKDQEVRMETKKPRRVSSYEFNQNIEKHPNVFIEPDFSRENPLHPYISNNKIQSILGLANDWELYSDNRKSRYTFPIPELQKNTSLLKPDLLLLSPRLKYILILELTIPWDFNMQRQSTNKAKRYKSLIRALNSKQYNVLFFTIEVGLTGQVGADLEPLFKNLGLNRTTRQRYLADITNTTLLASHSIWHRKRERKWKFWIFWKKRNQEKYRRKHARSKRKGKPTG